MDCLMLKRITCWYLRVICSRFVFLWCFHIWVKRTSVTPVNDATHVSKNASVAVRCEEGGSWLKSRLFQRTHDQRGKMSAGVRRRNWTWQAPPSLSAAVTAKAWRWAKWPPFATSWSRTRCWWPAGPSRCWRTGSATWVRATWDRAGAGSAPWRLRSSCWPSVAVRCKFCCCFSCCCGTWCGASVAWLEGWCEVIPRAIPLGSLKWRCRWGESQHGFPKFCRRTHVLRVIYEAVRVIWYRTSQRCEYY